MTDADTQNDNDQEVEAAPLPSRQERKAAQGKATHPWLIALVAVLAVAVAAAGYAVYRYNRVAQAIAPAPSADATRAQRAVDPVVPEAKKEPTYVLILGADRRPGQTRARTDTILIARIDPETEKVGLLSIPRDTRVKIPGRGMDKITHANVYGGPALAIETVKDFTGLPIHHYMEVDFEGFVSLVDMVGGVTVKLKQPINDPKGASSSGGVSNVTYIPAGKQTLNGQQALTFVRSRRFPDGDFTRIKNQQKFMIALLKKATSAKNLTKWPAIAEEAGKNLDTDMSLPELMAMAGAFQGLKSKDIKAPTPRPVGPVASAACPTCCRTRVRRRSSSASSRRARRPRSPRSPSTPGARSQAR